MKMEFKKLKEKEILDFCTQLCQPANFENKIILFFRKSLPSPFPHLLGFEGLTSLEIYGEKVTLASADSSYLLRILKNNISGELQAHLLHVQKEKYQYVFICLDGQDKNYLTDAHGRVNLGKVDLDLSRIKVSLCPPSAIFDLTKTTSQALPRFVSDKLNGSKLEAEFFPRESGQTLKIQLTNREKDIDIKRITLIVDESEILIAVPQKGLAILELPENFENLQINLYE